jgi:hypothetical protein
MAGVEVRSFFLKIRAIFIIESLRHVKQPQPW